MLMTITQYTSSSTTVGFLEFKQDYLHIREWKIAFYIHVFSAVVALLAGFTQFSSLVLKEHRRLHRVMGRLYAINIIIINFPAAMIMAVYANGHWPSKLAFVILDTMWCWCTLKAVVAARQKDLVAHREFMIRSFALTLSALSLRLWKLLLVNLTDLDPGVIYMMDAWLGFVPNLLLAEFIIRRQRRKFSTVMQ